MAVSAQLPLSCGRQLLGFSSLLLGGPLLSEGVWLQPALQVDAAVKGKKNAGVILVCSLGGDLDKDSSELCAHCWVVKQVFWEQKDLLLILWWIAVTRVARTEGPSAA